MDERDRFTTVLSAYVNRSAYTPGQLATLTSLPKTTIVNWLAGRVVRPRVGEGVVQLAAALRLTEAEADELLQAARQPPICVWRETHSESTLGEQLDFWEPAGAPTGPAQAPFQAIPLTPYFVGRDEELSVLIGAVRAAKQETIHCLHGMAGVGKTSLAARLAYKLRDHFSDGVLWARLDSSDTMSILATFATAYGRDVTHLHDVSSRSRVVRDLLVGKHLLLILDNAVSSEEVEPLLPPTGRAAVLVTTRRQDLAVLAGARRYHIRPFSAADQGSVALFRQIVGDTPVDRDIQLFAGMARNLGHLPLALVIAASRLAYEPHWQTTEFSERLHDEKRRLTLLDFEAKNVRESFAVSFARLPESVQHIFTLTGFLGRQDFSAQSVAGIGAVPIEDAQDDLRRLCSLSLVETRSGQRYQLHPLLHDFARQLASALDPPAAYHSYWRAYVSHNRYDHKTLGREIGHIETALQHGWQAKPQSSGWELLSLLMPYYLARGDIRRALTLLAQAKSAAVEPLPLTWIHLHRSQLLRQLQQLDEAKSEIEKGQQYAAGLHDDAQNRRLLTEMGIIHNCNGAQIRARDCLLAALALRQSDEVDDSYLTLLEELGVWALLQGNFKEAEGYHSEGYQLALMVGHDAQTVLFLKGLGAVCHLRGDREKARQLYAAGYDLARQNRFSKGLMIMGNNLGTVDYYLGKGVGASTWYLIALREAETLADLQSTGMILGNLGCLELDLENYSIAKAYFDRLLRLAGQEGWPKTTVGVKTQLGILLARQGFWEPAGALFAEALRLAKAIAPIWEADVRLAWTQELISAGDCAEASQQLKEIDAITTANTLPKQFRLKLNAARQAAQGSLPTMAAPMPRVPAHLKILI